MEDNQIELMIKTITEIREKHGDKTGVRGNIDCPVCGKRLFYVIHGNGHIWGNCETEGCLRWMM